MSSKLAFNLLTSKSDFDRKVYAACYQVPQGKVATYKSIAEAIGSPGACRAVGSSLRRNPFAPKVPCHRVVSSNLSLGGFHGSKDPRGDLLVKKQKLLLSEGVTFEAAPSTAQKEKRKRDEGQVLSHPSNGDGIDDGGTESAHKRRRLTVSAHKKKNTRTPARSEDDSGAMMIVDENTPKNINNSRTTTATTTTSSSSSSSSGQLVVADTSQVRVSPAVCTSSPAAEIVASARGTENLLTAVVH
eukprot:CAMPEP_0175019506 /NCGR_PEP_ID=MMETSP0005-20121125/13595_1 /TAXON_ID=420556 /ORGANISM="Ochromonas sp., Strain CCMP1393" /LENGTH=243 /DNA_ID=CAMNT_0016277247 /DNA_START=88 /DNA_END=818 /DNA_ORIENTATION=+